MRSRPPGVDDNDVVDTLVRWWDLEADSVQYVAKGAGSYHWIATAADGSLHFVTVDDLDSKPWLGDDRPSTFAALRDAFDTSLALREAAGLTFVVAPVRSRDGASAERLSDRYSIAMFPYVDGTTGEFDDARRGPQRDVVLEELADLHRTPLAAVPAAARRGVELPGRAELESALADVDGSWGRAPFAEAARAALERRAGDVRHWLRTYDDLTAEVARRDNGVVVTHGEPHGANFLRTRGELLLIDWDTVGLAVPERDLWMLDDDTPDAFTDYTRRTGRVVDPVAIALYRLTWTLADLAAYVGVLRSSRRETDDVRRALSVFVTYLQ